MSASSYRRIEKARKTSVEGSVTFRSNFCSVVGKESVAICSTSRRAVTSVSTSNCQSACHRRDSRPKSHTAENGNYQRTGVGHSLGGRAPTGPRILVPSLCHRANTPPLLGVTQTCLSDDPCEYAGAISSACGSCDGRVDISSSILLQPTNRLGGSSRL